MEPSRSFVAVPSDGWPAIAEALTASGVAWPEAAAIADLRWWVAEAARSLGLVGVPASELTDHDRRQIRAALPGRPALAARWAWTDWAVKQLRASPESWWQAERWGVQPDSASAPPAGRQRSASAPPAPQRVDAENGDDSASAPPALRQPAASAPPSRVLLFTERAEFREQRSTPPPPQGGAASPPAPGSDPLPAATLLALQQRDEPQHGTGQPRDHDALRRALGRGTAPEALAALWAWSGVSDDPLVGGCRAGGWRRWSALLRGPTGDERVAAAVAWDRAGRPQPGRTRPTKPGGGATFGRGAFARTARPAATLAEATAAWAGLAADRREELLRLARADLGDLLAHVDERDVPGLLEESAIEILRTLLGGGGT